MRQSRTHHLLSVFVVLLSFLFVQIAVATYVCPDFLGKSLSDTMLMTPHEDRMTNSDGCVEIDKSNPNLCVQYARSGDQSLDRASVLFFEPSLVFLYFAFSYIQSVGRLVTVRYIARDLLTREIAPPLAIHHCRFRI